jgi:hypothetical protein
MAEFNNLVIFRPILKEKTDSLILRAHRTDTVASQILMISSIHISLYAVATYSEACYAVYSQYLKLSRRVNAMYLFGKSNVYRPNRRPTASITVYITGD